MLSRSFALEGEVVFGGTIAAQQSYTYMFTSDYTVENQQILVNALLRFWPGGSSFELVGRGGYGQSIDRETSRVVIDVFSRPSAQPVFRRGVTRSRLQAVPILRSMSHHTWQPFQVYVCGGSNLRI
jgi:hypothetical protein